MGINVHTTRVNEKMPIGCYFIDLGHHSFILNFVLNLRIFKYVLKAFKTVLTRTYKRLKVISSK